MWVVSWNGGLEAHGIAEDARFVYWLLRNSGYDAGITYRRTYL